MIISASYKTDIPAFYGEWFMNRLRAGFCYMRNPYSGDLLKVSLRREDVKGFVFWTKNPGPFIPVLEEIRALGLPFILQFTINAYPRSLEFSVVDFARAIKQAQTIAHSFGPECIVWRYDPILATSLTDAEVHRTQFERLCADLSGVTNEVTVSFAQVYKKTATNMAWAAREFGFSWSDPAPEAKKQLLADLQRTATANSLRLTLCSQPDLLVPGVEPARCIDVARLARVAGRDLDAATKGNRPGCECSESRDIGEYDTCPHGCVYCYAVRNRALAQDRYRAHNPASELLFGRVDRPVKLPRATPAPQRGLFDA